MNARAPSPDRVHSKSPVIVGCDLLARAMVEASHDSAPQSGGDALKCLRMWFAASPLTMRVAALTVTMRR